MRPLTRSELREVHLAAMIFPIVLLGFAFQGVVDETAELDMGGIGCWSRSRNLLVIRNRCREKLCEVAAES